MNVDYGKLTDGNLTYAPNALELADRVILNPSAAEYLAEGWKAVDVSRPADAAPTGSHYEPDGWNETATAITRKWKTVADPAEVKVYRVEEIIYQLIEKGALTAIKALVGDYWELFTMRETLEADNDIFTAKWEELKGAIVAQGILTEAQIAEILEEAEI